MFKEYRQILTSDQHLSYELLSTYVNFYGDFSPSEKEFIESHLKACPTCNEKFNEVFDFEFEDQTVFSLGKMGLSDSREIVFYDTSKKIKLFAREGSPRTAHFNPMDESTLLFKFCSGTASYRVQVAGGPGQTIDIALPFDLNAVDRIEFVQHPFSKESASKLLLFQPGFWRYAAAAVIVFGISISGYLILTKPTEPIVETPPIQSDQDSSKNIEKIKKTKKEPDYKAPVVTKKSRSQVLLAENFTPHPLLENFVDQKFRSLITVEMVSPANGDTLRNPLVLKLNAAGRSYELEILNNKNIEVWRNQSGLNEVKVQKSLAPGLYYWKVMVTEELVAIRKFFVVE